MLRFSANLSLLFTELELTKRFEAAREAGFSAVEIQFPYTLRAEQIKRHLQQSNLQMVLFNIDADTLLQGGEGLAAVPEKCTRFRQAVEQALDYAEILQPIAVNVLPGRCLQPERRQAYLETFKNNLWYAAQQFTKQGVKIVFEAVNTVDMPGFLIHSGQQMLEIMRDVDHPNLAMQYDLYHLRRMEENCHDFLQKHLDKIGHIQFADCPGRGEPGSGESPLEEYFNIIENSPYPGWVGAEYIPVDSTNESLDWFRSYRYRAL